MAISNGQGPNCLYVFDVPSLQTSQINIYFLDVLAINRTELSGLNFTMVDESLSRHLLTIE